MKDWEKLEQHVHEIVCPHGRAVGTQGHEDAIAFLLRTLQQIGLTGYWAGKMTGHYEVDNLTFTNIIAKLEGTNPNVPPVLLAAHYDTFGQNPGADDNAAAVAILLELAAYFKNNPPETDILFAFFDAEEPPYYLTSAMGSIHFYQRQELAPVRVAIVLDLCGHDVPVPGFENVLFLTGMESAPEWENLIRECNPAPHLRLIPTLNRYIGDMSDYHIFRVQGEPYLFLSCGRWEHYHQPTDTPEKLNYAKMASVGEFLKKLVQEISQTTFTRPSPDYDPVQTEIQFLNETAGHLLTAIGYHPQSRKDVDNLVQFFIQQFGL
ncbi:MAG TPA: M28 family peptidase [Candidatus Hydrogenedentes bacterium]|nr:M28 family peptidase [Candidatus Hydrogenedentota bacterium]HOL78004.1 M28 family peptidase [Candidatus Hydrogenedentota bacterium]HPO87076.1 M28 family peptidase [Candidatus Hydrogenedentota bacterium]